MEDTQYVDNFVEKWIVGVKMLLRSIIYLAIFSDAEYCTIRATYVP